MAIVDISEYPDMAFDGKGNPVQTGVEPAHVTQQISVSGVSAQSAALSTATRFVRIHSDVAVRLRFGENPTAAGTDMRMAAGATEYFGVKQNSSSGPMKIAAITTT